MIFRRIADYLRVDTVLYIVAIVFGTWAVVNYFAL